LTLIPNESFKYSNKIKCGKYGYYKNSNISSSDNNSRITEIDRDLSKISASAKGVNSFSQNTVINLGFPENDKSNNFDDMNYPSNLIIARRNKSRSKSVIYNSDNNNFKIKNKNKPELMIEYDYQNQRIKTPGSLVVGSKKIKNQLTKELFSNSTIREKYNNNININNNKNNSSNCSKFNNKQRNSSFIIEQFNKRSIESNVITNLVKFKNSENKDSRKFSFTNSKSNNIHKETKRESVNSLSPKKPIFNTPSKILNNKRDSIIENKKDLCSKEKSLILDKRLENIMTLLQNSLKKK